MNPIHWQWRYPPNVFHTCFFFYLQSIWSRALWRRPLASFKNAYSWPNSLAQPSLWKAAVLQVSCGDLVLGFLWHQLSPLSQQKEAVFPFWTFRILNSWPRLILSPWCFRSQDLHQWCMGSTFLHLFFTNFKYLQVQKIALWSQILSYEGEQTSFCLSFLSFSFFPPFLLFSFLNIWRMRTPPF